jgi:hypothetical protein
MRTQRYRSGRNSRRNPSHAITIVSLEFRNFRASHLVVYT